LPHGLVLLAGFTIGVFYLVGGLPMPLFTHLEMFTESLSDDEAFCRSSRLQKYPYCAAATHQKRPSQRSLTGFAWRFEAELHIDLVIAIGKMHAVAQRFWGFLAAKAELFAYEDLFFLSIGQPHFKQPVMLFAELIVDIDLRRPTTDDLRDEHHDCDEQQVARRSTRELADYRWRFL
jgi:hypothetical protein